MRLLPWIGIALATAVPAQTPPGAAAVDPAAPLPMATVAEQPQLESPSL